MRFAIALRLAVSAAATVAGIAVAAADTATYTAAPVGGCPTCLATDPTGLVASAPGTLLNGKWNVQSGPNGLYVANGTGATFSLPGHTFDLTGLKLFGISNQTSTTAPLTYTLYAFHPGNPIADTVQVTINARVVRDVTLSDPRLTNLDTLVVRYAPNIGYTYFIQTRFTKH